MSLILLAAGVVGVVGIAFMYYLLIERSLQPAVEKTTNRAVGLVSGALASFITVLVIGFEAFMAAPELVITALGIGAIIAGISWEMFAATAFITYIVGVSVGSN